MQLQGNGMQHQRDRLALDDSPIADLYRRHAASILAYVRGSALHEDAEDVLLEVFMAAMQSDVLLSLGEKEQLAWLRRVAHNKCVDFYRRHRPAVPLEEAAELLFDDDAQAPEHIALRHEEYDRLRAHLAGLPRQQQEVLRLRFGDGLRCTEIARRLHKSDGAVRMLLSRSLNFLRSIYEKQ